MKELSLNILDIAMNSVKAEATRIDIEIRETEDELEFSVSDNGYGMSEERIRRVTDPFCTTRTTRKVGLGIPFLRMAAEQTGGKYFDHLARTIEIPQRLRNKNQRKIFQKAHRLYPARGYYINGMYAHPGLARDRLYVYTHGPGLFGPPVDSRNARAAWPGCPAVLGRGHYVDSRLSARAIQRRVSINLQIEKEIHTERVIRNEIISRTCRHPRENEGQSSPSARGTTESASSSVWLPAELLRARARCSTRLWRKLPRRT